MFGVPMGGTGKALAYHQVFRLHVYRLIPYKNSEEALGTYVKFLAHMMIELNFLAPYSRWKGSLNLIILFIESNKIQQKTSQDRN